MLAETARQLLTPGEIMQLPPDDKIVMVAGMWMRSWGMKRVKSTEN